MTGVIKILSKVRVYPNISIARVHLRLFSSVKAEELIKNINANTKHIRFEVAQRVRYQLRKMPELVFFIDDSLDYLEKIDDLLKK